MKYTVVFKPNTNEEAVRLIVNVPFLRSRPKSVPIRLTYSSDKKNVEMVEIFVPDSLTSEVPSFFIGELRILSPQIVSVTRA